MYFLYIVKRPADGKISQSENGAQFDLECYENTPFYKRLLARYQNVASDRDTAEALADYLTENHVGPEKMPCAIDDALKAIGACKTDDSSDCKNGEPSIQ